MAQAQLLPLDVELPLDLRLPRIGSVDAVALEARAGELAKRSIKKGAKLAALDLAIRMMDLTTLEGADTPGKVSALCAKAMHPDPGDPSIPSVAAVCVYPNLVAVAKKRLAGSTVKVASVATAFPSGQSPIEVKLEDVREAVALGADEIDMVIDRGAFLSGRYAKVVDEIVRVKEACGAAHLKVILETGELGTYDNVRRASLLAIAAGADFIKTSTGKVSPAATLPVTLCMLEVIRDVHDETGLIIGMKPAGGIRTAKQAIQYLCVLNETLGTAWMTPDLFRFGASSLLNDVLMQIRKQRTGRLPVRRLLHSRLRWRPRPPPPAPFPRPSSGSTPLHPRPARSSPSRSATASTSAASRLRRDRGSGSRRRPPRPRSISRRWRLREPATSTSRCRRRAAPSRTAGRRCAPPSAPSTCSGSRA